MRTAPFTVQKQEVLRYLGADTTVFDPAVDAAIGRAAALLEETASPRFVARRFDVAFGDAVLLVGTSLVLRGQSMKSLLSACDACYLLCATLGSETEGLLRTWQIKDLAFAAVLDACANSAVEDFANCKQEELRAKEAKERRFLTDRFSPGYGDFSIGIQGEICRVLDTARKIGVTVNESGILIPRKTITAVLGVSKQPQPKFIGGCAACDLFKTCSYRREGRTCAE
jgi:5-methyltetrahydrofolate--homocysteine methyltransferase